MFSQIVSAISSVVKFLSSKSDELIDVKIITVEFGIFTVPVPVNGIVSDVKKTIFQCLIETLENYEFSNYAVEEVLSSVKLIRMINKTEIEDSENLRSYELNSDEEILLIFRRQKTGFNKMLSSTIEAPTEEEIMTRTSHLSRPNQTPIYKINYLFFQDDLRKIFITLAKESAYILSFSPHSIKVLKYYRQKISNYMKTKENAFKVMYKLGFPNEKIEQAMKLTANNYKLALDWLIDNVKEHDNPRLSKSPRSSLISNKRTSILSASFELSTSTTIKERLDGLLGIVEFYSDMDEPVYDMNLDKMTSMGYDVEEAREALRMVKNNICAACEYLDGQSNGSIMELRVGLDKSTPIYNYLMSLPALQKLLTYSETFIYINKILEDHIIEWDPDISNGDLMREIITKYHDEKHCLVSNQFNKSNIPISALSAPLNS